MNKPVLVKIIWLCWFLSNLNLLSASFTVRYPEELNEKYILFTDRNYYAVNEMLYFKAFNNSHPLVKEKNWSQVLYIELLNSKGTAAFKGKFELAASGAQGGFTIPSDLPSGNYFLVAYTRWMLNFSPRNFACLKVVVINPANPRVIGNQNNTPDSAGKEQGPMLNLYPDRVECKLSKSTFSQREEATVTLNFPRSLGISSNNYCISVVKKGAVNPADMGIVTNGISGSNPSDSRNYFPELNGITISGRIVGVDDTLPVSNTKVQLAVLGNNYDYFESETDADGNFLFSLQPTCNKNEMFLTYDKTNQQSTKILIDHEYGLNPLTFPDYPFLSTEEEVKTAEEIMFNMQVNQAYMKPELQNSCYDTATSYFYVRPLRTVYIKKYVELPSMYEVFIELVPEVMITRKKGKRSLEVKGNMGYHPYFTMFEPLVLIDMIPVSDIDELLRIPPRKINHIDLVNEIYVKGDNIFGGIISIFSEKGDLAGIKLPDNSTFFNYEGFSPEPVIHSTLLQNNKPNIPDFRNTLFWEPNFVGKGGSEAEINFRTSDVTGDYVVLIRGLSKNGNIIVGRADFRVE